MSKKTDIFIHVVEESTKILNHYFDVNEKSLSSDIIQVSEMGDINSSPHTTMSVNQNLANNFYRVEDINDPIAIEKVISMILTPGMEYGIILENERIKETLRTARLLEKFKDQANISSTFNDILIQAYENLFKDENLT